MTVTIAGVDLEATFPGLRVALLPDALHRARVEREGVAIPGYAGRIWVGPADVPDRTLTIRGILSEATAGDVRDTLDELDALIGTGDVEVITGDRPDRRISAFLERFEPLPYQPQMLSGAAAFDMVFRASMPYWEDVSASVEAFTSTPTAIPTGTAPSWWTLRILGPCTNPVVTYATSAAETQWTCGLTATILTGDSIDLITSPLSLGVFHTVSAVTTQDDTLITSGRFPRPLDPADGVPYTSSWPTVAVTVDTGTASGEARYRRMWR